MALKSKFGMGLSVNKFQKKKETMKKRTQKIKKKKVELAKIISSAKKYMNPNGDSKKVIDSALTGALAAVKQA